MKIFQSLIFRYLAKEVFITLVSLTLILLLIFMSNQFISYLNRAASGQFPLMIILKLMMLELPNLMSLLLPLGFYLSLLIAYGRLYADSEMTVLRACGYSNYQLFKHSFIMAAFLAFFVAIVMIWASPYIATERAKLLRNPGLKNLIQAVTPGRFQSISDTVFYVESLSKKTSQGENIFLSRFDTAKNQWHLLFAKKGYMETNEKTDDAWLVLEEGRAYQGKPGKNDWQVIRFSKASQRLPQKNPGFRADLRTEKTAALLPWITNDPAKAAEFQWRVSIPLMIFTLTLAALPLSKVNPRSGKYSRLLPALIVFIIYANLLFVFRSWITNGKLTPWIGIWPLHLGVILTGLGFIWYNKARSL